MCMAKHVCAQSLELVAIRLKMQVDMGGHPHRIQTTISRQLMMGLGWNIAYAFGPLKVIERSTVLVGRRSAVGSFGLLQAAETGTLPKGYIQPGEAVG